MSDQLYNVRRVKKLNFKIYKQVYTSGPGIYFSKCVKSRLFHRFCNLLTLNVNTEENGNIRALIILHKVWIILKFTTTIETRKKVLITSQVECILIRK